MQRATFDVLVEIALQLAKINEREIRRDTPIVHHITVPPVDEFS